MSSGFKLVSKLFIQWVDSVENGSTYCSFSSFCSVLMLPLWELFWGWGIVHLKITWPPFHTRTRDYTEKYDLAIHRQWTPCHRIPYHQGLIPKNDFLANFCYTSQRDNSSLRHHWYWMQNTMHNRLVDYWRISCHHHPDRFSLASFAHDWHHWQQYCHQNLSACHHHCYSRIPVLLLESYLSQPWKHWRQHSTWHYANLHPVPCDFSNNPCYVQDTCL